MNNDFENQQTMTEPVGELLVKRKRISADVILLVFICLLVLLSLTTLTFLKYGSEQVLTGDLAFAEEEQNTDKIFSVGLQEDDSQYVVVYNEEDGYVQYSSSEEEQPQTLRNEFAEDVLNYAVAQSFDDETGLLEIDYYDHDEEGNIILNTIGDPVVLHYSKVWPAGSIGHIEVDMDKLLGLTGEETEEEALDKMLANNAAYAAQTGSYGWGPGTSNVYRMWNRDGNQSVGTTQFQVVSNASVSHSSSGGNGSGCDAYCYYYASLNGVQWRRWCNNWVAYGRCTYGQSGSGSSGYYRDIRIGWMGSAAYGNDSGTGWRNGSGTTYTFFITGHGHSNSTGSCSGSSVSVGISSIYMYFCHTNGNELKISSETWTKTWANYRSAQQVSVQYYSRIDYIRYFYMQYSTSSSGDSWVQTTYDGAQYKVWNTQYALRKNSGNCYSNIYVYADDQAYWTSGKTYTGSTLYIDNYAPVAYSSSTFRLNNSTSSGTNVMQSSSNTQATVYTAQTIASTSTTLYLFQSLGEFTAWSNRSGISGMSGGNAKVWATNSQNGVTVNFSNTGTVHTGSYYWWRGAVSANNANGCWTVYAKDYVGNQRTLVSNFWISCVDCEAPVSDNNFTVHKDNTKSNAGTYWTSDDTAWNSYNWASAPLYCYMSFYDRIGTSITNTTNLANIYQHCGLNTATLKFFYNGKLYVCTAAVTASGGGTNITNYVGMSDRNKRGKSSTNYMRCYVYFYMPYDYRNVWTASDKKTQGFTLSINDYAGHTTTVTINSTAFSNFKIDTVAPQVQSVTVSGGTAENSYTGGNPVITIKAQDFANTSSSISGNTYCNNGSGLKAIYIYNVDPRSNRTVSPVATLTSNSGGTALAATSAGNSAQQTFTWTVSGNWDSYNISGATNKDPWFYVVAVDWAGNRSDAYNGYNNTTLSKNRTQNNTNYKSITAPYASAGYQWTAYYKTPDSTTVNGTNCIRVYRDTFTPVVRVYTDANCTAANCIASTDGTNSSTVTYYYQWEKITSKTLYVQVICGSSGGQLKVNGANGGTPNSGQITHYRSNGLSYSGSPGRATYTKFTVSLTTPGDINNTIYFAGKTKNSATVTIKTRMDTSLPTINLLGFSNGTRDASTIGNAWNATEAGLTSNWTGSSYYAVFKISDTYSGLSTSSSATISYGKNGNATTQTTQSKYTFIFTYSYTDSAGKTHIYTKTTNGVMQYFGNNYYVQVKVFDPLDMQNITNSGTYRDDKGNNRTFLSGGLYDITPGTYLHYTFKAKDFIGNENTYTTKSGLGTKDSNGNTTDLVYKADPFPVDLTVNTYTVASKTDFDAMVSAKAINSKAVGYTGGWTKAYVLIRITIVPGLSNTGSSLGYRDIDNKTGAYSYSSGSIGVTQLVISQNKEEWWYFTPGTRALQLEMKAASQTKNKTTAGRAPVPPETMSGNIEIRQDNTPPVLSAAFFATTSTVTSLSDSNIVMYYDYIGSSFYLNKTYSKKYNESEKFIWTDAKLYLYMIVSDCVNGLNGSGVCQSNLSETGYGAVNCDYYVTTYSSASDNVGTRSKTTDRLVARTLIDNNSKKYLYRSSNASNPYYGYVSTGDTSQWDFSVTDTLGNKITGKIGGFSTAGTNTVTNQSVVAHKMFPVVDSIVPTVALTGTHPVKYSDGTTSTEGSYTGDVNGTKVLRGWFENKEYYTQTTELQLNFSITIGISGYKLYLRKRDFKKSLSSETGLTSLSLSTKGNVLPDNYNFSANGWGYFNNNSTWTLTNTSQVTYTPDASLTRVPTQTNNFLVKGETIKNRFDLLIVSGTGKYYLIEMGDVLMDNAAPVFYNNATFFSMARDTDEASGGVVDFNLVRNGTSTIPKTLLWSNTVADEYTNGKVYCYFAIEDLGIGVDDNTVKANGIKLTKLTVNNLRVVTIGGVPTKIVWFDNLYTQVTLNASATNGCYAVTIKKSNGSSMSVATDITYGSLSSTAVSQGTTSLTYYRYLASSSGSFQPTAADRLGKTMSSSTTPSYAPLIDANDVSITVNMYNYQNANGDAVNNQVSYKGNNNGEEVFTRTKVDVEITVKYGTSGFGLFTIQQKDMWDDTSRHTLYATKNYNVYCPTISKSGSYVLLRYYDATTDKLTNKTFNTSPYIINYNSTTNTIEPVVSGNKNYWKVNGVVTDIEINSNRYSGVIDKKIKIAITPGTVNSTQLTFTLPANNNCKDEYKYSFQNGVTRVSTMTRSGNLPSICTTSNTKYVYMDTEAPVIDTNSGTYKAIAEATSYNRFAKLLSVGIADNFSMGKAVEVGKLIDNVKLSWKGGNGWSKGSAWMLNDYRMLSDSTGDGLYRPTAITYNGDSNTYTRTSLVYCEYNAEYTITAVDKAGNKTEVTFTPKIDTVQSTITSLRYETYNSVTGQWDEYVPGNWAQNKIKIIGRATYGRSGFILQARNNYNGTFTESNWKTLAKGIAYTTPEGGNIDQDVNTVKFEIILAEDETAYFQYYNLRILSNAEYYEMTNGASVNNAGTSMSISRPDFVDAGGNKSVPTKVGNYYLVGNIFSNIAFSGSNNVGCLKVDKVTPGIDVSVSSSQELYGGKTGNVWVCSSDSTYYVNEKVDLALTTDHTADPTELNYASGNVFYYTTDLGANVNDYSKWVCLKPNGNRYAYANGSFSNNLQESDSSVVFTIVNVTHARTGSSYAVGFTLSLCTSQNNFAYKFYVVSGAGKFSEVFTVKDIRIDINTPTISVAAVDSYEEIPLAPTGQYKLVGATNYNSATYEVKRYSLVSNTVAWTKKNTVIMKVEIGNVGYSGAKLYLQEALKTSTNYVDQTGYVEYYSMTYNDFLAQRDSGTGLVVLYIAINQNGDRRFTIKATENAVNRKTGTHKESDENTSYIKIDNSTPVLSVASITSQTSGGQSGKAANWNYAGSGDKWYVEDVKVKLKAGLVEKVNGEYTYRAAKPYSGFKVYAARVSYIDDNGRLNTTSDADLSWMEVSTMGEDTNRDRVYTITGLIIQGTYRFKVVSNSGMEFILGDGIFDSTSARNEITTVKYNAVSYTKETLQKALGMSTGHNIDGVDDESFAFAFNVDTNRYQYTYDAQLCTAWSEMEENRVYNTSTSSFVNYVVYKGDWSNAEGGAFSAVNVNVVNQYKHGDIIKVVYASKSNDVTVGGKTYTYNNFHNYTEIRRVKVDGEGNTVKVNSVYKNNDGALVNEEGGSFTETFGRYNIKIVADFGAELVVDYGSTTFYMQTSQTNTATTGSVRYYWGNSTTPVTPELKYEYYKLELDQYGNKVYTDVVPTSNKTTLEHSYNVGAYYVVPYIALYDRYTGYTANSPVPATPTIYEKTSSGYVITEDTLFLNGKDYFVRNSTGNFRVAIRESGAPVERQEFVVKYFDEYLTGEDLGYFAINNLTDFKYIAEDYYVYNPKDDSLVKASYLQNAYALTDTEKENPFVFKLKNNITFTPDTFRGLNGTFEASLNGNNKTITVTWDNGTLTESYGIFDELAGTVTNLEIVSGDRLLVSASGSDDIYIGLLAKTMNGGTLKNVIVSATDVVITSLSGFTGTVYFGGIAATDNGSTLGSDEGGVSEAVFTDVRVRNDGANLRNARIGGMFGTMTATNFIKAIAYGDITVYDTDSTVKVGIVSPVGSTADHSGLRYYRNNTFFNDNVVSTIGQEFNSSYGTWIGIDHLTENASTLTGAVGDTTIVEVKVRDRVLTKLYADFGYNVSSVGETYGFGWGTSSAPLEISTVGALNSIEKYVNLNYTITDDIDISTYRPTVIHKVFSGKIKGGAYDNSTEYKVLSGFGKGIDQYGEKYFGFFGQLNGTIENIVFAEVNVDFTYTGSSTLMAGIVAGQSGNMAIVDDVLIIGITSIVSTNRSVYAGGVVGYAAGSTLRDILSMNNLSVTAPIIKAGGIVGQSGLDDQAVIIARQNSDNGEYAVFSLGRVETKGSGSDTSVEAGAILGSGQMKSSLNKSTVYALLNNTYILGVVASDKAIGNGSVVQGHEPVMVKFDNQTMRDTRFNNNMSSFSMLFNSNNDWYPVSGAGLVSDPFIIQNEADFKNINLALYAYYRITSDISFSDFQTIGEGLNFTGTIDGTGEGEISASASNIVVLTNVTKPLVYTVMGTIQNLSINVNYTKVVKHNETLYYAPIAVKLMAGGNIKNITIDGTISITGEDDSTTAYVSGFAAIVSGGTIDMSDISDASKLRNNISALNVNIRNIGTLYVGGYAASVEQGGATFSFGISNGTFTIEDCKNVIVGFLVGQSFGECEWDLPLSSDYFYNFDIITNQANGVQIVDSLEKPEDDNDENRKNLIGRQN